MTTIPAPPPRRVRNCPHGPMEMTWVADSGFRNGGYWSLHCDKCESRTCDYQSGADGYSVRYDA